LTSARTDWIDNAKAIGIILVVYGHVARGLFSSSIDTPQPWYQWMDQVVYSFHMPLFFFLSGLFFNQTLAHKGTGKLVLGKIDTLLYPYVIWSLIQGGIEVAMSQHSNGLVTSREVLALWWQPRAQFWFLYALFFVFAFASLVYGAFSTRQHMLIFGASILLYLFPPPFTHHIIPNFIVGHLVFFCLGIVFTAHLKIEQFSSLTTLLAIAITFLTAQWLFHGAFALPLIEKSAALLALTVVSILFVVSLAAYLAQKDLKFLTYIGASSMAIYLMHILAGSGVRVVLMKVFHIESFALHLLVGCMVGVLAPMLAITIIRQLKIPFVFSAPISKFLLKTGNRFRNPRL
jgi:fucose 4-O-acetylase-like acetyltransferase